MEIRLYREMGLPIPIIQKILYAEEAEQKQYLAEISEQIHADIRKRSEDAQIIDLLQKITRQEFCDAVAASSGLEDLRASLLRQNQGLTGGANNETD